jgi:predicted phage terminase large subunit-like protein
MNKPMNIQLIKHNKCYQPILEQYLRAVYEKKTKLICNEGGARSGKTYDFFVFCIEYAKLNRGKNKIIRVFREKNVTCIDLTFKTDFMALVNTYNLSHLIKTSPSGHATIYDTEIYFNGLINQNEIREAAQSDVLFFNEAMENNKDVVQKWIMRCSELVVFDWNPAAIEHWLYDYEQNPDCVFTHTTYKDNTNLSPSIVKTIEGYEPTPENIKRGTADEYMWNVYGLGLRSVAVGMMYDKFKTYEVIPENTARKINKNYTDTADEGDDYLCSVNYVETEIGCYITDVLFTQKPMEFTEHQTARMLLKDDIKLANIESNNGGRGFARNVEKEIRENGNTTCTINSFYQGANKKTRIFTNSAKVQNIIYFPADWKDRWPEFHRSVMGYKKEGKNTHDDAPDVLTGIAEFYDLDRLFPESSTMYFENYTIDDNKKERYCFAFLSSEYDIFSYSAIYEYENEIVKVVDVVCSKSDIDTICNDMILQISKFKPVFTKIYAGKELKNYTDNIRNNSKSQTGRYELKYNPETLINAKSSLIKSCFSYISIENQSDNYRQFMADKHNFVKDIKNQSCLGLLCDSVAATFFNVTGKIK